MRKMICFTMILVVMFLLPLESLAAVNGWICPFCDSSTYITRICLDDDVQLGVWLDSNAIWHGDHFDRRFCWQTTRVYKCTNDCGFYIPIEKEIQYDSWFCDLEK